MARDIIQPAVRNKDLTAQNIEKRIAGRIAEWLPETKKRKKRGTKKAEKRFEKTLDKDATRGIIQPAVRNQNDFAEKANRLQLNSLKRQGNKVSTEEGCREQRTKKNENLPKRSLKKPLTSWWEVIK